MATARAGAGGDGGDATQTATRTVSAATWIGGVCTALETWQTQLESAGVPDVENGEAIATEMRGTIAAVRDDFSAARDDVQGLSTSDPAAFAAGVSEIGTTLTEAGTAAGTAFDRLAEKYLAADLDAAATEAASCQNVLG